MRRREAKVTVTLRDLDANRDGPPLSTGAAAALLGLSTWTVRELVEGGDIRATRIGKNWRIPWVSMRAYLVRTHMLPLRPDERS